MSFQFSLSFKDSGTMPSTQRLRYFPESNGHIIVSWNPISILTTTYLIEININLVVVKLEILFLLDNSHGISITSHRILYMCLYCSWWCVFFFCNLKIHIMIMFFKKMEKSGTMNMRTFKINFPDGRMILQPLISC